MPSPTPLGMPSPTPLGGPSPKSLGGPSPKSLGMPSPTPLGMPSPTPLGMPPPTPPGKKTALKSGVVAPVVDDPTITAFIAQLDKTIAEADARIAIITDLSNAILQAQSDVVQADAAIASAETPDPDILKQSAEKIVYEASAKYEKLDTEIQEIEAIKLKTDALVSQQKELEKSIEDTEKSVADVPEDVRQQLATLIDAIKQDAETNKDKIGKLGQLQSELEEADKIVKGGVPGAIEKAKEQLQPNVEAAKAAAKAIKISADAKLADLRAAQEKANTEGELAAKQLSLKEAQETKKLLAVKNPKINPINTKGLKTSLDNMTIEGVMQYRAVLVTKRDIISNKHEAINAYNKAVHKPTLDGLNYYTELIDFIDRYLEKRKDAPKHDQGAFDDLFKQMVTFQKTIQTSLDWFDSTQMSEVNKFLNTIEKLLKRLEQDQDLYSNTTDVENVRVSYDRIKKYVDGAIAEAETRGQAGEVDDSKKQVKIELEEFLQELESMKNSPDFSDTSKEDDISLYIDRLKEMKKADMYQPGKDAASITKDINNIKYILFNDKDGTLLSEQKGLLSENLKKLIDSVRESSIEQSIPKSKKDALFAINAELFELQKNVTGLERADTEIATKITPIKTKMDSLNQEFEEVKKKKWLSDIEVETARFARLEEAAKDLLNTIGESKKAKLEALLEQITTISQERRFAILKHVGPTALTEAERKIPELQEAELEFVDLGGDLDPGADKPRSLIPSLSLSGISKVLGAAAGAASFRGVLSSKKPNPKPPPVTVTADGGGLVKKIKVNTQKKRLKIIKNTSIKERNKLLHTIGQEVIKLKEQVKQATRLKNKLNRSYLTKKNAIKN